MRYPPQFLDRLRQHFRLSEVVGQRITLKRAGREFQANCPFHNEKSPSFTVNDEKGFFHCFGCGAHGDVIGFIKDYDNLSYTQAVETLARQAGMALPDLNPRQQKQIAQTERLYGVMEAAANWFSLQLRQMAGSPARDYMERRGLTDETIREFRLGFAPARRTALKDAMLQKGLPESNLLEAGLLTKLDDGTTYDKFRGRIIFPINDSNGRIIAFGGRLIDPEAKGPKYLNSPDTPLFKKSYNLYHLDVARRAAPKAGAALVAEGYMDVIALAQAGMEHAVAPLGTAITKEQLALLWQVVDEPVLCLDGDQAGWRAMERALELALPLLTPGKSLAFVRLPEGEDPDSMLRKHGASAMEQLITQRMPLVEVLWRKYFLNKPLTTPEQQAGAEKEIMRAVEAIKDASVQEHYRKAVRERLWSQRRKPGRSDGKKAAQEKNTPGFRSSKVVSLPKANQAVHSRDAAYASLLALLCYYPNLLDAALEEQLGQQSFRDPTLETIRSSLMFMEASLAEDRQAFQEAMARGIGEVTWRAFLESASAELTKEMMEAPMDSGLQLAQEHLFRIQLRLELLQLNDEMEKAKADFSASNDLRDWERFQALIQRMHEVERNYSFPENS